MTSGFVLLAQPEVVVDAPVAELASSPWASSRRAGARGARRRWAVRGAGRSMAERAGRGMGGAATGSANYTRVGRQRRPRSSVDWGVHLAQSRRRTNNDRRTHRGVLAARGACPSRAQATRPAAPSPTRAGAAAEPQAKADGQGQPPARERARIAKAQNKDMQVRAKQKQPSRRRRPPLDWLARSHASPAPRGHRPAGKLVAAGKSELPSGVPDVRPQTPPRAHRRRALLRAARRRRARCSKASATPSPTRPTSPSLIFHTLPDLNWAGFYWMKGGELVLGPFQGKPACVRIAVGKGVCGTAARERRTIVVPDVRRVSRATSPATRPRAARSWCRSMRDGRGASACSTSTARRSRASTTSDARGARSAGRRFRRMPPTSGA